MSKTRILVTVFVAVFAFGHQTAAQSLTFSLFERYLGALRDQAGIPGMAAAIVQNGEVVWDRGFGYARVEGAVPVDRHTPFSLNGLTQVVTGSLVLEQCIGTGEVQLEDAVQRWSPNFGDRSATFAQVMSNTQAGGFRYDTSRFSYLERAVEECADRPFPVVTANILAQFGITDSVPGGDVANTGAPIRSLFPTPTLNDYIARLKRVATPYRVDSNRRATASTYVIPALSAADTTSDGLVASLDDVARFDGALDAGAVVRSRALLATAWQRQPGSVMGLGWFVQEVGRHHVVWQFGQANGAYSSLIVKVPNEHLTLILLANSDALTAPYPMTNGDVTVSPFARIFFTLLG